MRIAELEHFWQKFIQGDQEAFGSIYEISRPILTFYCLGILKEVHQAENCASEALIKTYHLEDPGKVKDIESWLFTVARNLCISHLRKVKRHQTALKVLKEKEVVHEEPLISQKFEESSIEAFIANILDEEEEQIWKLHSEGYDNNEIAIRLGMNKKTVANNKSKIRSLLKARFKKYLKSREY